MTPRQKTSEGSDADQDRANSPKPRGHDTRIGLLEAAERIILEEGIQALTVRRVGAVSGLNPTLVTYHFGAMGNLLAELCRLNLEPMLADWEAVKARDAGFSSLREVLEAWMTPLLRPAAFTSNGRAIIVLDEIAAHGDEDISHRLLAPMRDMSARVQSALRPYVSHLSQRELRARVRFLSAATLGPPPRARVVEVEPGEQQIDGIEFLLNFAEAALTARSAETLDG